jgi:hypothetical protein
MLRRFMAFSIALFAKLLGMRATEVAHTPDPSALALQAKINVRGY